jgi:hypothetical protein
LQLLCIRAVRLDGVFAASAHARTILREGRVKGTGVDLVALLIVAALAGLTVAWLRLVERA